MYICPWLLLEAFGSSLYELDEVSEVFSKSTLQGLLYVSARSTLDPEEAVSFRKVLFGLILKRVETWRNSYSGPYERGPFRRGLWAYGDA
ncbi:unnamed protein product [Symbiodinium natans]|uniref:Uncharacterized protein n=1 Tax=Symbiodinium natans TaxID=878477 RepID=A0A812SBP6_9DINO|nr:unnamed protein product [Symbiodinium natans]